MQYHVEKSCEISVMSILYRVDVKHWEILLNGSFSLYVLQQHINIPTN
jgi:hypothetical protein